MIEKSTSRSARSIPTTMAGPFRPGPGLLAVTRELVGIAAIQYAGIVSLAWALLKLLTHRFELMGLPRPPDAPEAPWLHLGDALLGLVIVASVAVFWWAKRAKEGPPHMLAAAAAYYVAGALGISMAEAWAPLPAQLGFGISWATVWIAVYPLVVPLGRRSGVTAAFVAAATGPLSLGLAVLLGHHPSPAPIEWLVLYLPNALVALLAATPAENVYRRLYAEEFRRDLGEYELVAPLGHGGMGEVWIARHLLLSRPAAVKLIKPKGARPGPDEVARFEREAHAISTLTSPHTVTLYTFGLDEDGRFFFVMELLDGVDLQRLVDSFGPLPPARVAFLLAQACHSLAEAHAHGLVHRDIKPANLVACRLGLEHDFVKVLDFGLVKPQGIGAEPVTREGITTGTPEYMAPEQVTHPGLVGPAADLYSLGALAFYLLTGETLFTEKTPMQMALAHVHQQADPPSALVDGIPDALDALVLELLHKDPTQRPVSAEEVGRRLGELTGDWSSARARDWWKEHQPTTAMRAAVAESGLQLVQAPTRDVSITWVE